ncbi:hypothetical protein FOIG_09575 [Fusarium odoratissimum NRRL 54006]|uniref:Uncharacterized protein n=2 Tax=Fusarium oxysporum species complex TaxID=171631 RepID=X0JA39_FUSO5|nr:uncharacterized protein FOIG_09575 [Fusarium odoratissimum NRRL 54006]EXL98017.1 hypothetical protein FOIG_09575 [Fusarium odoratissimum NRRL 54006]TXB95824.1 hypothetical protein FocTR4_00016757 [Fusarium oxysporum f. sp. cubense]
MTPRTCDNARETEDLKAHSVEFRVPPERLALEDENALAKEEEAEEKVTTGDRSYSAPVGDLTGPNVTTQSASK